MYEASRSKVQDKKDVGPAFRSRFLKHSRLNPDTSMALPLGGLLQPYFFHFLDWVSCSLGKSSGMGCVTAPVAAHSAPL